MFTFILVSTAILGLSVEARPLTFSFPGGNVTQYVEAVREIDSDLTVIVNEEVREVTVPAFRLTLETAASERPSVERLITEVLPTIMERPCDSGGSRELLDVSVADFGGGLSGRLCTINPGQSFELLEETNRRYMMPIGLGQFIRAGVSAVDLLDALERALEAAVAGLDPKDWSIRYHEPTGLAFVVVPSERSRQTTSAITMLSAALTDSLEKASPPPAAAAAAGIRTEDLRQPFGEPTRRRSARWTPSRGEHDRLRDRESVGPHPRAVPARRSARDGIPTG